MSDRPEFDLTAKDKEELIYWKVHLPFRDWHGVKLPGKPVEIFDTKRKAMNFARKNSPCAVHRIG